MAVLCPGCGALHSDESFLYSRLLHDPTHASVIYTYITPPSFTGEELQKLSHCPRSICCDATNTTSESYVGSPRSDLRGRPILLFLGAWISWTSEIFSLAYRIRWSEDGARPSHSSTTRSSCLAERPTNTTSTRTPLLPGTMTSFSSPSPPPSIQPHPLGNMSAARRTPLHRMGHPWPGIPSLPLTLPVPSYLGGTRAPCRSKSC